jgi:hypothetical protein
MVQWQEEDLFHECHARMHSLIHDGRLHACPSCLLGLMYVCRIHVRS